MEIKKTSKASLENKKSNWLLVGYVIVLVFMFVAFEWSKRDVRIDMSDAITENVFEQEIEIPITEQPELAAPPPPQAPAIAEVLTIVDDNDNEDEEAKNYWIVHGFTSLSESVFCISYRGYHLPIFPTLMIIWKLAMSKKFPCQITFHNNKSSSGRNQTRLDGRTKTVRLNRTMYNSVIRGRWGCSTNWRSSFLPRN